MLSISWEISNIPPAYWSFSTFEINNILYKLFVFKLNWTKEVGPLQTSNCFWAVVSCKSGTKSRVAASQIYAEKEKIPDNAWQETLLTLFRFEIFCNKTDKTLSWHPSIIVKTYLREPSKQKMSQIVEKVHNLLDPPPRIMWTFFEFGKKLIFDDTPRPSTEIGTNLKCK